MQAVILINLSVIAAVIFYVNKKNSYPNQIFKPKTNTAAACIILSRFDFSRKNQVWRNAAEVFASGTNNGLPPQQMQGRTRYRMQFSDYTPVPFEIQKKLAEDYKLHARDEE